jgi:hypothetical protein
MRGLAQAEDLARHFSEPFEADLDRQVTPGDHHRDPRVAHRRKQNRGKVFEALPGLDLQHEAEVVGARDAQTVEHMRDVRRGPHERHRDQVGMFGDERQWASSWLVNVVSGRTVSGRLMPFSAPRCCPPAWSR